jgi:hypothetical protein
MRIPAELATLLASWPRAGHDEQAFPFLTVDENHFPHVTLLCTAELHPDGDRLLVAVASATARANLARTATATLIAADGVAAHYAKLAMRVETERDAFACYAGTLTWYKRDSLDIPLRPMTFRATPAVADAELWTTTRAALTALAAQSHTS